MSLSLTSWCCDRRGRRQGTAPFIRPGAHGAHVAVALPYGSSLLSEGERGCTPCCRPPRKVPRFTLFFAVPFTPSHLQIYIFTPSHLLIYIFTPSHLLIYIFTPSHLQIYIFTPSHLQIYIFTPSHLQIYIFTPSHLQI